MAAKLTIVFVLKTLLLIFLLLGCLLPSARAAENIEGDLVIRYFGLRQGRLAFTYQSGSQSDIYVIDFSRLSIIPVVKSPGLDEYPRWSPDGQKLVFHSDRSGNFEIYCVNADGSGLSQLTNSPESDKDPDWSADGKQIVFQSSLGVRGSKLFVMNADGSALEPLEIERRRMSSLNTAPRWSPRGDEIIYATNEDWPGWDIAIYELGSKKRRFLTKGYQSFTRPSWHPNGGSIVFSYGAGNETTLWQLARGASKLDSLVIRPSRNYDAEWSHDGKKLFFAGEMNRGKKDYQLFIWDKEADRTERVVVSKGPTRHPSWTPLPSLAALERTIKRQAEKGK